MPTISEQHMPPLRMLDTAGAFLNTWHQLMDQAIIRIAMAGWKPNHCMITIDPSGKQAIWVDVKGDPKPGEKIPGVLVYEQWCEAPTVVGPIIGDGGTIDVAIAWKWHTLPQKEKKIHE